MSVRCYAGCKSQYFTVISEPLLEDIQDETVGQITTSYENYLKQNQSTTQQRAAKEPTFTCAKNQ